MPKLAHETTRSDAADYLDTKERQVTYIAAALETGEADFVRDALGLVERARHKAIADVPSKIRK